MVKVKSWATTEAKNQRFLTEIRIYSIPQIIRGAHMVSVTAQSIQYWFVNNHIDWDQFNTLYDEDFEMKETCAVDKVAGQFK